MSSEEIFEDPELLDILKPEVNNKFDFLERKRHICELGETVIKNFPTPPDDKEAKLLFYFYYSVQYLLLYAKFNGVKPIPDIYKDSDDTIMEKAYFIQLDGYYKIFTDLIKDITNNVYNKIYNKTLNHCQNDPKHRIFEVFKYLVIYKEMHSRRIKSEPTATRTKTTEVIKTKNIITDEYYDAKNKDHKTWRVIIFNPLPSDFDPNAKDPNEGEEGKRNAIMINHLKNQGKETVPDAFCFVVTTEFDKLFRLLHVLLHFNDYMFTHVIGSLTNEEFDVIDNLTKWQDIWRYVMKEHHDVDIKNLSKEKKKDPKFVSGMSELRDFLKVVNEF